MKLIFKMLYYSSRDYLFNVNEYESYMIDLITKTIDLMYVTLVFNRNTYFYQLDLIEQDENVLKNCKK